MLVSATVPGSVLLVLVVCTALVSMYAAEVAVVDISGAGVVDVVTSGSGVVEVVSACVVVSLTTSAGANSGINGASALISSTVKLEASPRAAILLASFSTADKVVSVSAARSA